MKVFKCIKSSRHKIRVPLSRNAEGILQEGGLKTSFSKEALRLPQGTTINTALECQKYVSYQKSIGS